MNRNLVIGASGLVGTHLDAMLRADGQEVISTYFANPIPFAVSLNVQQKDEVIRLVAETRPTHIFLPAATPNVDYCENHPKATYQTNVLGVKNVVMAANNVEARIIYFSSDYIFDGESGPYDETEMANPISEYGRQKLAAEHCIALNSNNYLIIRTTVVYGWERQGKNFVFRLIKSLQEGKPVKAPIDQVGSPTYARHLAQAAMEIASHPDVKLINIAGRDCLSRYDFARRAAKIFGVDEKLILPITTVELNQAARRPLNAGLKIDKLESLSKTPIPDSDEGLAQMANDQSNWETICNP